MLFLRYILLIMLSVNISLAAENNPLSSEQTQRYQDLLAELRCLVCQNQNLAESHSDLADDLRNQVHKMIVENKTDAEIKAWMSSRYGDFILYQPPVKKSTWLLWFLPFILLFFVFVLLAFWVKKKSKKSQDTPEISSIILNDLLK